MGSHNWTFVQVIVGLKYHPFEGLDPLVCTISEGYRANSPKIIPKKYVNYTHLGVSKNRGTPN